MQPSGHPDMPGSAHPAPAALSGSLSNAVLCKTRLGLVLSTVTEHRHTPGGGNGFPRSCLCFLFRDRGEAMGNNACVGQPWGGHGVAGTAESTTAPRGRWD